MLNVTICCSFACAFQHAKCKVLEHALFQTWRQPASTRLTFPAAIFPSWTFRPDSRRVFWSEKSKATLNVSLMWHKGQIRTETGEQTYWERWSVSCLLRLAVCPLLAMDTNSQQTWVMPDEVVSLPPSLSLSQLSVVPLYIKVKLSSTFFLLFFYFRIWQLYCLLCFTTLIWKLRRQSSRPK